MYFCFVDDTEFLGARSERVDSFAMGAYVCDAEQLASLKEDLDELKEEHDIPVRVPLKWNLRDQRVERACMREASGLHRHILDHADELRRGCLEILRDHEAAAYLSCRIWSGRKPDSGACYLWAFSNLLQRVAFWPRRHRDGYPNLIVISDRRRDDTTFDEYSEAYWRGRTLYGDQYFAGSLRSLQCTEGLLMGTGIDSSHLQLADILAGAGKTVLEHLLHQRHPAQGPRLVRLLSQLLARHQGRCVGISLVVYPSAPALRESLEGALTVRRRTVA